MTFTNKKNIDSGNKIDITVIYLKLTFPINVPKDKIKRTLEITNPKYWNNIEYKIKQSIQGNFTYTPPAKLDKRFWKKDTFNNGIFKIQKVFNDLNEILAMDGHGVYVW